MEAKSRETICIPRESLYTSEIDFMSYPSTFKKYGVTICERELVATRLTLVESSCDQGFVATISTLRMHTVESKMRIPNRPRYRTYLLSSVSPVPMQMPN